LYNATNGNNWTNKTGWNPIPGPPRSVHGWNGVWIDCWTGHITHIDLTSNNLVGTLPAALKDLSFLKVILIQDNPGLVGSIPPELSQLTQLTQLLLTYNSLSGEIPSQLGNLSNLEGLALHDNNLTGSIPSQLGNLTKLRTLTLGGNSLTGSIPVSLGNLTKLIWLELEENQLLGAVPQQLSNLTDLFILRLNDNLLSGDIQMFSGLTKLVFIALGQNQFSGSIPGSFGSSTVLEVLSLANNFFTGTIPSFSSSVLHMISLENNQLNGSVHASFANLPELSYFDISNNQLSGLIPPAIGDLPNLASSNFFINNNKFTFTDILPVDSRKNLTHYSPQDLVDVTKTVHALVGMPFTLVAKVDRATTPASKYQWFRNGVAVSAVSVDSAYTIPAVAESDGGAYHYTIINDNATNLTLVSRIQTVIPMPVELKDICIGFGSLPDWLYTPNWAEQIALCNARAQQERLDLIEFAKTRYIEEQASLYRSNCIAAASEQLRYSYTPKEHHYTLFYYDQAGNLVQTVPPEGVKVISNTDANSASPPNPPHTLVTRYQYSSINQLAWQTSPDAGVSEFFYDKKGQLRLSRNAQQAIDNKYSYTKFDKQGRVIEVGELAAADLPATITPHIEYPNFPIAGATEFPSYPLSDITHTYYDTPNNGVTSKLRQQNLRGRVSYVEIADANASDKTITLYSYDIHGNVRSLIHQIPGLKEKRTDYVYDLVSGKVNYVFYQYGKTEQFIHKYTYDADNRIKTVLTSADAYLWTKEASYQYYAHGPLARTELGHHRVQGQDFYYTLQGWIKGVNMPFAGDPGTDGISPSKVGKDAYAYALGYYLNDYKPSGASIVLSDTRDQLWPRYTTVIGNNNGLYNGNIAWMVTDLAKIGDEQGNAEKGMQAMMYKYDQLHRIRTSRSMTVYTQAGGFTARAATPAPYDEDYTYDGNGNILTLQRYNQAAALVDNFSNQYYPYSNKLRFLHPLEQEFQTDLIASSGSVTPTVPIYRNIVLSGTATIPSGQPVELVAANDISLSPDFSVPPDADFTARMIRDNEGTYEYDAIGNLIADNEKIVTIRWTPYGKVREVNKNDGAQLTSYLYDAAGNRVLKKVTVSGTSTLTHYVRDASGNVMATYTDTTMTEQPIYGSARLGEYKGGVPERHLSFGERQYALTNHLGNVLTVMTDNVTMQGTAVSAKVLSVMDYYPFGLEMTGRKWKEPDNKEIAKATGMSAQYQLDGSAQNKNGNGMNGVVTGAVLIADNQGYSNKAYLFDGVDDKITLSNSSDSLAFIQNTGIFTITAFIKINNLNARNGIVGSLSTSAGKGFNFIYDTFGGAYGNHQLQFTSFKAVANDFNLAKGAQFTINDNQWHHVAVVGDGQQVRFYVDGVPDGSATTLTHFSTGGSTKDAMIGGAPHATNTTVVLPMNGGIDEVNIFKKALSQSDIAKLAQRQPLAEGDEYRYAFNGKEKENGDFGDTSYDYGFRIYNPRIGKFLSVDPLTKSYPMLTPYQFASNSPMRFVDIDGLEGGLDIRMRQMEEGYLKGKITKKELQDSYKATAVGAAMGIGVLLSRGAILRYSPQIFRWLQFSASNPALALEGTAAVAGFLYEGADDLCPTCKGDELARVFKGTGHKMLNFFGGKISKYTSALNIDPQAEQGFKGTIQQFSGVMKEKGLLGTVDNIVADNPYGYSDYLVDAADLLKEEGTVIIRGTQTNKFFNQILKGTAKGLENFEVTKQATKVSDEVKAGMAQTDGTPIKGDVYEVMLKRKRE
jgi:RHS repeat-associated protein